MMPGIQVVVLDDDPSTREFLQSALQIEGHACETFVDPQQAEAYVASHPVRLVMVDVYLGDLVGIDFVQQFRRVNPDAYYIVMTAHISLETAARSMAEGAVEYVSKPLTIEELKRIVGRARAFSESRKQRVAPVVNRVSQAPSAIIGRSSRMLDVYRTIARVAPSNANVLISGASGTGKELVARAIHQHSKRAQLPFTAVNCGSFTETILESELFGHERGAFTGADATRKGLIETTDGGTLFLDEITETTLGFQVKLLRVIQEQQVRRVGSNRLIPVNVRIVAASNRDVLTQIKQGLFREDLYYRLTVVRIEIPPLDDRRDDIPLLVEHFLSSFNARNDTAVTISSQAVRLLQSLPWPGNVRELENTIQRLAIFAATGQITEKHVEEYARAETDQGVRQPEVIPSSDRLLDHEREHIKRVLRETQGNRSEAARRLGIERKTLYKKALRLGIDLQRMDG